MVVGFEVCRSCAGGTAGGAQVRSLANQCIDFGVSVGVGSSWTILICAGPIEVANGRVPVVAPAVIANVLASRGNMATCRKLDDRKKWIPEG
jgi:hypothetical protein